MNTSTNDKKCFKSVTHCIFDMDGLLLDTEVIYDKINKEILAKYNKPFPYDICIKILGTTDNKAVEIIVNDLKLPITVEEYLEFYNKMCRERLSESPLMRGVIRLLRHLSANKIPIAIGTSSDEEMVQIKMSKHQELFKLFHHIVCGSTDPEVKQGKPAPDTFLVAASRFDDKPDPSNCLVFEDAPNGVRAAISAGMQVVMVPDDRVPAEMRKQATLVLKSLEHFRPEQFGLPPFPHCGCPS